MDSLYIFLLKRKKYVNSRCKWGLKQRGHILAHLYSALHSGSCLHHSPAGRKKWNWVQMQKADRIMNWFVRNTKVSVCLEKWSFIFLDVTHIWTAVHSVSAWLRGCCESYSWQGTKIISVNILTDILFLHFLILHCDWRAIRRWVIILIFKGNCCLTMEERTVVWKMGKWGKMAFPHYI